MDRDELGTILSEQKLGMSGITDEYSTFKRLKGVHYLIFGKLSQVYFDKPVPKQESRQTTGTVYYDCTKNITKASRITLLATRMRMCILSRYPKVLMYRSPVL